MSQERHPRFDLDPLIHAPVRLSIMAMLAESERVDFRFMKDSLAVSDSLLSKHLTTLEGAGYIRMTKTSVGRRVRTWIQLEPAGVRAFSVYRQALNALVR